MSEDKKIGVLQGIIWLVIITVAIPLSFLNPLIWILIPISFILWVISIVSFFMKRQILKVMGIFFLVVNVINIIIIVAVSGAAA